MDPRKTALARASSIYTRPIRPLVRDGAPQKQDRNCQTVGARSKVYRLTDRQSQCDFDRCKMGASLGVIRHSAASRDINRRHC
jgi:hypothetical protein